MDLDLIKTFLEVYQERHFGRAAENLFITPSAVSARVRLLEEQLGVELFRRARNNLQLTPAGERLLNHAKNLLKGWERARYDVIAEVQAAPQLRVAGVAGLWDTVLMPWMAQVRAQEAGLGLRLDSLSSADIVRRLQQNQTDLGFMFEAQVGPELALHEAGTLPLVMIASAPDRVAEQVIGDGYVMVDWSASFMTRHAALFPDAPLPSNWVSSGRIALDLISTTGGGCYLPEVMARESLAQGRLFMVEQAPLIHLSIYSAYPVWSDQAGLIERLLPLLKLNPVRSETSFDDERAAP